MTMPSSSLTLAPGDPAPIDPFQHLDSSQALKRAVEDGNRAAVQAALARGGDPNRGRVINARGAIPLLMYAVQQRGHPQEMTYAQRSVVQQLDWLGIAQMLLDAGANPEAAVTHTGNTVWHVALEHQDNAAVQLLLRVTARGMNAQRVDGCTPLHALAEHPMRIDRFPPAALRLIHAGADLSLTNDRGSVLHAAMTACRTRKGKLSDTRNLMSWTRALLAAGLDLSLTNHKGQTVMHWVAEHKRLDLAVVLWTAMPDESLMDTKDLDGGRTPWDKLPGWRPRDLWRHVWASHERNRLLAAIDQPVTPVVEADGEPAPVVVRRLPRRL